MGKNIRFHSCFFAIIAVTEMAIPKKDNIKNEILKLVSPAIKPINGGPIRSPIIPIEDTAAMATGGDKILNLPAALNTNGIAGETPIPTRNIPIIAGHTNGNKTAINKPAVVEMPQRTIIFLKPM